MSNTPWPPIDGFNVSSGSGASPDPATTGSTSGGASSSGTYGSSHGGIYNSSIGSVIQQLLSSSTASMVNQNVGHPTPKLAENFSVEFLGFTFATQSGKGIPNVEILEESVVAVAKLFRRRGGWDDFGMAFIDDDQGDVSNILNRELDEHILQGTTFDVAIHYYDTQGNESSTIYAYNCSLDAIEYEQLDVTNPSHPLTINVMIKPGSVKVS